MKGRVFVTLVGMFLSTSAYAIPMKCEQHCEPTEVRTQRWVETSTVRWVEAEEPVVIEEILEDKPKPKPVTPRVPRKKPRVCTDQVVYDWFFFNAHSRGGNYGGAYVSGRQMNDSQGMVIRCPDPVKPSNILKSKDNLDPQGMWVTDYGGFYVYDILRSENCSCYPCEDPPDNPVPEPATMLLFGTGLLGLAGICRRKNSD